MLHRTRILDLACLVGLFTIEFARMGASTVGIEIRDTHLAKANFSKRTLNLDTCSFVKGDVRHIDPSLGNFDVTICADILYHLDFPDCVSFLSDIADRTSDILIIDSHLAYDHINESVLPLSEMRSYEHGGRTYRGRAIIEHAHHVTADEKAKEHIWASIDNDVSVWLHETDLVNLFKEKGFNLVANRFPNESYKRTTPDRPTLVFKRSQEGA
ncbi:MAG: class I SAM-dependent methyltransferase [Pseudomonadota bacterium]